MKLKDLFKDSELRNLTAASMIRIIEVNGEVEIKGITDDSRKAKPGFIFVAIKGLEYDGHGYIEQAIRNGAVAVLFDVHSNYQLPITKYKGIIFVGVRNTRRSLGLLWASWYGFPGRRLKVIGVTGTDGKTTTTNLIYHILNRSGKKVGMISTINARIGERKIDTGFHVTNPEPELLQKLLGEMVEAGIEYAVLEITSHGLAQERTAGVNFSAAVITNVTHEHLDYHKTYKAYLKTKGKLFEGTALSVLNRDDSSFNYLKSSASGKIITYGIEKSNLQASEIYLEDNESEFFLIQNIHEGGQNNAPRTRVRLNLPGLYNIYNALAAAAVCLRLGLTTDEVKKGLESFTHLEGRFDEIRLGQPFRVIIDFAHTPNALEQVLGLLSKISRRFGSDASVRNADRSVRHRDPDFTSGKFRRSKVIVVFGCAGERDKEKRPMMGEISGGLAEMTVLTAEDPRREDVDKIINHIAEGCRKAGAVEMSNIKDHPPAHRSKVHSKKQKDSERFFIRVPDRKEAIEFAISQALPGDIILVTGKGHEKSMCFGTKEYSWSDKQAVSDILKKFRKFEP